MLSGRDVQAARHLFYDRLKPDHLAPLWEVLGALVTPEPRTPAVTKRWRFAEVRPLLMEAAALISAMEAERRVLILENPAFSGQSRITNTLYAGLQLLLAGEVAPAHRHTQSALRFVMEGVGAFTSLDGERAYMTRYDLILTPNWVWHDHGNETDEPMIWLDGLDIPLVQVMDASFAEHRADRGVVPETHPLGDSRSLGGLDMRPPRTIPGGCQANPRAIYPYSQWREALDSLALAEPPHPHDGYRLEFTSPLDGGPVLATISAFAQLIPAGFESAPVRSTDGTIFVVTEGLGSLNIGDVNYQLAEGDIIVAPSWIERRIVATTDLVFFSFSDRAAQEKLGFWRESSCAPRDGARLAQPQPR